MTVIELINELLLLPPDKEVVHDNYEDGRVNGVWQDENYIYLSPDT
jgi:hypothetical protein